MRNIIFHGELADFIGHKSLEAKVSSVAETMRFLICNFPKVEAHMAQRYYKILIGKNQIEQSEIHYPMGSSDINIVPVISGAGGNFGKIFLGAALIGASFFFPGAGSLIGLALTPFHSCLTFPFVIHFGAVLFMFNISCFLSRLGFVPFSTVAPMSK